MSSFGVFFSKHPDAQYGESSTLHRIRHTLNPGTGRASLLFTSYKLTSSNSDCALTDVLISPRCSTREAHSISGQWKTVECFWVDMPPYMHCQVSTGLRLIWWSVGCSFREVSEFYASDLTSFIHLFFCTSSAPCPFEWEHEAFACSTSAPKRHRDITGTSPDPTH